MNKRNWTTHALFLGLIAVAIFQVTLYRQMRSLERKLDREQERARSEARVEPAAAPSPAAEAPRPETVTPAPAPSVRPVARPRTVATPAAAPAPTPSELEAMVRKVVQEEQAKSPQPRVYGFTWKDPMTVMKEELKLSPSQEARILDLRRQRQEWLRDMARAYKENPNPDPAEYGRARREYQTAYKDALKRELDLGQQKRFDELVQEGRLMEFGGPGGNSIMITTSTDAAPVGNK